VRRAPEGPRRREAAWARLLRESNEAVAGIWRDTAEWGPAYSMVMTEACEHVAGVHERMPAILPRGAAARRHAPSLSGRLLGELTGRACGCGGVVVSALGVGDDGAPNRRTLGS